tara:strand:+ start:14 stop:739 length:726 start_codon:yes stop_codon:yes gene_type:complete
MDNQNQTLLSQKQLESFFLNQNVDINFINFFTAIILSLILSYVIKYTYIKVSRTLNDKEYFSETFVPLAIITTLVITVIKFSLALSLGLVGALSIVRFRAAIKEPEELVYLFFIIAVGLANGANQFLLSIISTIIIVTFLFIRASYVSKKSNNFEFNADVNILNVNLSKDSDENLDQIVNQLKPFFKYLKLKSANISGDLESYVFWYDIEEKKIDEFLKILKKLTNKNVEISVYSKTGAYE